MRILPLTSVSAGLGPQSTLSGNLHSQWWIFLLFLQIISRDESGLSCFVPVCGRDVLFRALPHHEQWHERGLGGLKQQFGEEGQPTGNRTGDLAREQQEQEQQETSRFRFWGHPNS